MRAQPCASAASSQTSKHSRETQEPSDQGRLPGVRPKGRGTFKGRQLNAWSVTRPVQAMQISIRFVENGDADALHEAARESTREVFRWLPWCRPEYSLDDARTWIAKQIEARVCGSAFEFAIISPTGRFLGGCGLNHINETDRRANLGYWVRTSASGQGVATTAVRALSKWAFRHTQLERLEIVAATGNLRSQRVAEKLRAVREGVARSRLRLHHQFHDAVVYSIVRSSWPDA